MSKVVCMLCMVSSGLTEALQPVWCWPALFWLFIMLLRKVWLELSALVKSSDFTQELDNLFLASFLLQMMVWTCCNVCHNWKSSHKVPLWSLSWTGTPHQHGKKKAQQQAVTIQQMQLVTGKCCRQLVQRTGLPWC